MKQMEALTHVTHVNGWEPAVYIGNMSQNFRVFHEYNLSVLSFRICLLICPGSVAVVLRHGVYGITISRRRGPIQRLRQLAVGSNRPVVATEARKLNCGISKQLGGPTIRCTAATEAN